MWCQEGDGAHTGGKRRKHDNTKIGCMSERYATNTGYDERDNRAIISVSGAGKVRFIPRNRLHQGTKQTLSGHEKRHHFVRMMILSVSIRTIRRKGSIKIAPVNNVGRFADKIRAQ